MRNLTDVFTEIELLRAAMRDVCRVMNVPLAEADRLAKLI
ncbi:hypothetical protein LCGC14_3150320, partial [marine sediment metagenome]